MPSGLHRTYGAHHLHFITCSCYRRLPLLCSARSRDTFLKILEQTRERYRFVIVGYVVMPEHIHLLVTEPEVGTLSTVMQVLKQRTAHALLPKRKRRHPRQRNLFGRRVEAQSVLAGALLRLQRVDDEEARGKAPVYASQSSEARLGQSTGAVAVEQLPFLPSRRGWTGAGERGLDEDFVSESGGLASPLQAFVVPAPSQKKREGTGHPLCRLRQRNQKPGPPAKGRNIANRKIWCLRIGAAEPWTGVICCGGNSSQLSRSLDCRRRWTSGVSEPCTQAS